MTFNINNMPRIIIFEKGVMSRTYSHGADLVINHEGWVIKDRTGRFGMARRDEMEAAILVTKEMAREAAAYHKARARTVVDGLLGTGNGASQ